MNAARGWADVRDQIRPQIGIFEPVWGEVGRLVGCPRRDQSWIYMDMKGDHIRERVQEALRDNL